LSERGEPSKNKLWHLFLGVVGCGGWQKDINLPKMSCGARFWGLWVVVVT